jgi:hypothetical protein
MNTWETIENALDRLEKFGHHDFEITEIIDTIRCSIVEIDEESKVDQLILEAFNKKLGNTEYDKVVTKVVEEL